MKPWGSHKQPQPPGYSDFCSFLKETYLVLVSMWGDKSPGGLLVGRQTREVAVEDRAEVLQKATHRPTT